MTQDEYRAAMHFRPAIMKATGEDIFVDDVTFDPAMHEEIVPFDPAMHEEIVPAAEA